MRVLISSGHGRDLRGKLLRLGTPIGLAALIQTLYNLADTFWLGRLGPVALNAPVISFNLIFLMISFEMGLASAGTTAVSQYTGAGRHQEARRAAGNVLVLLGVGTVCLTGLGLWAEPWLLRLLRTPTPALPGVGIYFRIMVWGLPLAFPFFAYQAVLAGWGDTRTPLKIELLSAALNAVLDPWFILGGMGLRPLGVAGAALASVISRGLASVIGLWHLFRAVPAGMGVGRRDLWPRRDLLALLWRIGLPGSLGMAGTSLGFLVLMEVVNRFGTGIVALYGIANRVVHLFMMPAMGLAGAVTIMVGQKLGAGALDEAREVVRQAVLLLLVFLIPGLVLVVIGGGMLTRIFLPQAPHVLDLVGPMYALLAPSVLLFALSMVLAGAFQGAGYTVPVMTANLSRLWVFRLPLLYGLIFGVLGGVAEQRASVGIWWSMLLSNAGGLCILLVWYLRGGWLRARIGSVR